MKLKVNYNQLFFLSKWVIFTKKISIFFGTFTVEGLHEPDSQNEYNQEEDKYGDDKGKPKEQQGEPTIKSQGQSPNKAVEGYQQKTGKTTIPHAPSSEGKWDFIFV